MAVVWDQSPMQKGNVMSMTPEENEANIQEILRTCPGMTREKIAEWDSCGRPARPGEIAEDYERRRKRRENIGDWSKLSNPIWRDILKSSLAPTEKITRLVDMWLKENPDFKVDDEAPWHPCYIALLPEMKPWLFAQCNDDAEYVGLWELLLAAAKEWFPDKAESKAGRSFCYHMEATNSIAWHGWESMQPVFNDYLEWRYGTRPARNEIKDMDNQQLKALRAYAKMMNTLQTEWLGPLLAENLRYNSQWVFEEMRGKQKYLEYMQGKFQTITKSGSRPHAEIGELQEYPFGPCVILAQGDKDNLVATVLVGIEDGLVAKLDMCAVPDPMAAIRTGEYPGVE